MAQIQAQLSPIFGSGPAPNPIMPGPQPGRKPKPRSPSWIGLGLSEVGLKSHAQSPRPPKMKQCFVHKKKNQWKYSHIFPGIQTNERYIYENFKKILMKFMGIRVYAFVFHSFQLQTQVFIYVDQNNLRYFQKILQSY